MAAEFTGDWQWQNNTDVPFPHTEIRTNSGEWQQATSLRISHFNADNVDVSATLLTITSGQRIWLQDKGNLSTVWASWSVTGAPVDNTADASQKWVAIPVTYIEGGLTIPQNNLSVLLTCSSTTPAPIPPDPPYLTGGPAFPAYPTDSGKYGLSILDFFAAHVISGIAAYPNYAISDLKTNGPQDAYWIAARMVELRDQLVIKPTPVPPEVPPEPVEGLTIEQEEARDRRMTVAQKDAVYSFGPVPPPAQE